MTSSKTTAPEPHDDLLWLEDIHGERAMEWVRARNAETEGALFDDDYRAMEASLLEVLDAQDRIPMATKRGEHYYNFWRDAQNPKGLWRRTSWEQYSSADPQWQVLLDIDALAAAEGTDWVFAGSQLLRPAQGEPYRRALLRLSPDGGDAVRVREFDLESLDWVRDGFDLPVAKTNVSWHGPDALYVASDFGEGTLTRSSYARTVREMHRGGTLEQAPELFAVDVEHILANVVHDPTPGFERGIGRDVIDFYNSRTFIRVADGWEAIDVPTDVGVHLHRQWVLFSPQTPWEDNGLTHAPGSLLAAELEAFRAGDRKLTTVFAPTANTSLESFDFTGSHLLLNVLRDVVSVALVADPANGFASTELELGSGLQSFQVTAVDDLDPSCAQDYWFTLTGFLTPTTLGRGTIGGPAPITVKSAAHRFADDGYVVEQFFAISADGTRVPYFQVSPAGMEHDGANPVLMNGYGGFQQSLTPSYSGAVGRGWLERRTADGRGGVYVLANIRGGGEYGPDWHRAALRENRHRAYEDFAAIARDLIRRRVTAPARLAATGRSNGGLLMGNMITGYPELFGAVSCGVPLLDMRRYTRLSAGHSWVAEYGDPDIAEDWEFIRTFSPYHRLDEPLPEGSAYPPCLIWSATSDDRVGPVQARKMAAKMLAKQVPDIWYHEALDGGHAGASDNGQSARMLATSYEFLWRKITD